MIKNLLFLVLSIFLWTVSSAQQWTSYASDLNNSVVNCIVIDQQNKKWIATTNGVYVFDGSTWINYNTTNSALPHNNILSLAIDQNGDVWTGMAAFISKFDGTNWTTFSATNGDYPGNLVRSIAVDGQNNKWFGTSVGASKFDGSVWTNYNSTNSGLAQGAVKEVAVDGSGKKWFGSTGVSVFDGTNWTNYNTSNSSLPSNNVTSITFAPNGDTWIGSGVGVSRLKNNVFNSYMQNGGVLDVEIDPYENIWVATSQGAIFLGVYGNSFTLDTSNSGIGNSAVRDIAFGANCNIWFGTENGASVLTQCLDVENLEEQSFDIYPNPTNGEFTVQLGSHQNEKYNISIYGIDGKLISTENANSASYSMDISLLDAGLYVIKITKEDKSVTQRIVKH